jgi:hypothetical protein
MGKMLPINNDCRPDNYDHHLLSDQHHDLLSNPHRRCHKLDQMDQATFLFKQPKVVKFSFSPVIDTISTMKVQVESKNYERWRITILAWKILEEFGY